jgi:hypothetical protein
MTITIEIKANKKELEKYFEARVYSKTFKENVKKVMGKQCKTHVDFLCMQAEGSICSKDEIFTLSLAHYGTCELPIKKSKKSI